MKRNKLFYKMIMLAAISLTACTDLDVEDKTALTSDLALNKVSAFQNTLASAYSRVNDFDFYGRDAMLQGDVLADNFYVAQNSGRYTGEQVNATGAHFGRWGVYTMINDCNIVLDFIDGEKVTGTQAEKDPLKGEAYFLRALAYHELLRSYAYEPNKLVNGFNLGVVLRTTAIVGFADVTDEPRSLVQDGYILIKSDLNNAINLLPAQGTDKYHATKAAAQGLLARVLLYEGSYADAAAAADAALAGTTATLVTSASYVASFSATPHPESIFESEIRNTDWSTVDGANNSLSSYTMNTTAGNFFCLSPTTEFEDLVAEEATDVRNNMIITSGAFRILKKWPGEKGTFMENIPVIRYSEVLLTAAEAKARSGNEGGARTDISRFRTNRIPGSPAVTASGTALIDLILRERRLEFIGEGHRYYDLKRLGLAIPKSTEAKSFGAADVPYNSFKILSRIPVAEINISKALEQNPGY